VASGGPTPFGTVRVLQFFTLGMVSGKKLDLVGTLEYQLKNAQYFLYIYKAFI